MVSGLLDNRASAKPSSFHRTVDRIVKECLSVWTFAALGASGLDPVSPIQWITAQMHDSDDQDVVRPDLVDDSVQETANPAAAAPLRDPGTGERMLQDSGDCLLDLGREFVSETGAAILVIVDRPPPTLPWRAPGTGESSPAARLQRGKDFVDGEGGDLAAVVGVDPILRLSRPARVDFPLVCGVEALQ